MATQPPVDTDRDPALGWVADPRCRRPLLLAAATILLSLALPLQALEAGPSRDELVDIFQATRALQVPNDLDGIPDYTPAAIQRSRQTLTRLRETFNQLDPTTWPQRDQVDYLLTRSELDKLSYGLYEYRPTSRNPTGK